TETFVNKIKEFKPKILGLSSLLTTTMPVQKEVIEALIGNDVRENLKILVGGAPVTEEWAKEIGADAYGADASDAVVKTNELLK
ncbi:MAG: cobalamin B12-binding domain-containing protein, partial [Candidatus Helarchaeota archaeon]